jgi:hypothetical protein
VVRLFGRLLKKRFVLLQPLWLFSLFDWLAHVSVGHVQRRDSIRYIEAFIFDALQGEFVLKNSLIAV